MKTVQSQACQKINKFPLFDFLQIPFFYIVEFFFIFQIRNHWKHTDEFIVKQWKQFVNVCSFRRYSEN